MSVTSVFFNAIQEYSKDAPNLPWHPHPLSFQCLNNGISESCLNSAKLVNHFFTQLLKPLEAYFGNCKQSRVFVFRCPSYIDPADILTLHIQPTILNFAHSKGYGRCISPLPLLSDRSPPKPEELECFATNELQNGEGFLKFEAFGNGLSQLEEFDRDHTLQTLLMQWDDGKETPKDFNGNQFSSSYLNKFITKSANPDEYLRSPNGLFKAFIAATEPKQHSAEESLDAQENRNDGPLPEQKNAFGYGLLKGVLGTMSVASGFWLFLTRQSKQPIQAAPEVKEDHQTISDVSQTSCSNASNRSE